MKLNEIHEWDFVMKKQTSRLEKLKKEFPIVKDLYALKKRGVDIEDAMEAGMQLFKNDPEVKFEYFGALYGGIPSVYVGVTSKQKWVQVRDALRQEGVIR